ncbi:MAG: hypothetical protein GXX93_13465 [Anaerolineae bacterium]|nr:hypothetical protein [Anaerolineae bacterium]
MAMDLFGLLKRDHKELQDLMDEMMKRTGRDAQRADLFRQIQAELLPHMAAEELVLYPELLKHSESEMIALEGIEEHKLAESVRVQLVEETITSNRWLAMFKVMKESIEHHVEEEEGELFDKAKQVLSDSLLKELASRFEAEKKKAAG